MSGYICQAAMAAALLGAVAGCSGGSSSSETGTPGLAATVAQQIMTQRRVPAEPAPAADPQALAAEALAVNPGPLILVGLEGRGTTQVLAIAGENQGMRTYMTKNEQALIMRGFMLTGTRGLGHDLSVAEAEQSATLIASGRSSSATRIMRYYSADGLERPMDFSCQIGQAPNAGVMVEACAGHGIRFENSYLPSAGVSRQWIGPGLGYVTIQVLRD